MQQFEIKYEQTEYKSTLVHFNSINWSQHIIKSENEKQFLRLKIINLKGFFNPRSHNGTYKGERRGKIFTVKCQLKTK